MFTENRTYTLLLLGWLRSSYEKDQETGLYYAGARYQVPRLGSFNSTDPLWWKSPDKTSYHYCSNNPIMRVDPDGRLDDEWDINSKGEVVNRIKTDKHDAFYIVDDNGRRIDGKSVSFEYGTIKHKTTSNNNQAFEIKGNEHGKEFFDFVIKNTNVEWSKIQFYSGKSYLYTSNSGSSTSLIKFDFFSYYGMEQVERMDHNHPSNSIPVPSVADRKTAGLFEKRNILPMKSYVHCNGITEEYNSKSTDIDFQKYLPKGEVIIVKPLK